MYGHINRFLAVSLLLAFLIRPAFLSADTTGAVAYLKSQPMDAWSVQALVAAGEAGIDLTVLETVAGNLSTDYAKTILALAAAGENPSTFGNVDYVAQLKTYYADNQIGDPALLNDDAWALLALASVGELNSTEAQAAKNYLLNNQNDDGGWGYATGGDSDSNDTAAVIMALAEAGLSAGDPVMSAAVAYLAAIQNDDGGFGWNAGSLSDSGSDSWVICALNKTGEDPALWEKNGQTPVAHLESLQDSDGGFWWVEPGTTDFNNKAMTAYAIIALSGKSFPIGYYEEQSESATGAHHLRIEGRTDTVCDISLVSDTALDIVKDAALPCAYTYFIEDTAYGPYLKQINEEAAAGLSGWMYFVNYASPAVGAADYVLSEGDEVLWYYGDWGWLPLRLETDTGAIDSGAGFSVTVKYYDGQNWLALEGATVHGGAQDESTDASGQVTLNLPDGYYVLYAQKSGYVRSNKEHITVGSGVPQSVGLTVEIEQTGGGPDVAGESLIFTVSPDELDFGKMKPGGSASEKINLKNEGTVRIAVSAAVSGQEIFVDNLRLDEENWSDYSAELSAEENKEVSAELKIPESYLGSGFKTGELVFWATAK